MEQKAIFCATLKDLPQMLHWVRERLHPLPIEDVEKNRLEVAAEEILVNIICYAYGEHPGEVEITWKEDLPLVLISFKDFGKPFNPLEHEHAPNHQQCLEQKHIGGLGIFFVKQFVDHIEYQYAEGANIVTLTKKLNYA